MPKSSVYPAAGFLLLNELRGEPATEIILKIWRPSTKKRLEVKLIRVPMIY